MPYIYRNTSNSSSGGLTDDDIGQGLKIEDGKLVVNMSAQLGPEFSVAQGGQLQLEYVDVNKVYVPQGTELIVGG